MSPLSPSGPGKKADVFEAVLTAIREPGPAAAADPLLGTIIGRYRLIELLGRGGLGVVYKAQQAEMERVVALKMMYSGRLNSPEEMNQFRGEAAALGRMEHRNVVRIYEVGELSGTAFFSMEYCPRGSLEGQLRRGLH